MDIWDLYHSGRLEEFSSKLSELETAHQCRTPKWIENIDNLFTFGKFTDRGAIEKFIQFVSNPNVGDRWLQDALNYGTLVAPSPFGEGILVCRESFYLSVNMLFFRAQGGEVVIVYQSITSVDTIYFPMRDCFFAMRHPPTPAIDYYTENFCSLCSALPVRPDRIPEFGGLIVSHFFPFHFYSELVPAFERLHASSVLEKVSAIFIRKGGAFLSPKQIWPEIKKEIVFEAREAPAVLGERLFLLHGTDFNQLDREQKLHAENAYAKVIARSQNAIRKSPRFREFQKVANASPVVWFGVQSAKRSWVEQIEGTASIIKDLRRSYPGLFIVFDGWTSPIDERKDDEGPIADDREIVSQILEICGDVPNISTIGWSSLDKAAVASQVDAFVTNFSTGSLHVARLAQKAGVGHINTVLDKTAHIHYATKCLSEGVVIDNPEDAHKRADAVSYSLDWRIVLAELKVILGES